MAIVNIFRENPLEMALNSEELEYKDTTISFLSLMASSNRRVMSSDKTKKRNTFSGVFLRLEKGTDEKKFKQVSPTRIYEPGSYPWRKYAGKTKTPPIFIAVKVYVPEIHSMLPVPTSKQEDSHSIIDLYPTFYAMNRSVIAPKEYGEIVRVRYGDIDNFEDPIYLGPDFGAQTVY